MRSSRDAGSSVLLVWVPLLEQDQSRTEEGRECAGWSEGYPDFGLSLRSSLQAGRVSFPRNRSVPPEPPASGHHRVFNCISGPCNNYQSQKVKSFLSEERCLKLCLLRELSLLG